MFERFKEALSFRLPTFRCSRYWVSKAKPADFISLASVWFTLLALGIDSPYLLLFAWSLDALDGYVARATGTASAAGAVIDLVCDLVCASALAAYISPEPYLAPIMCAIPLSLVIVASLSYFTPSGEKAVTYRSFFTVLALLIMVGVL